MARERWESVSDGRDAIRHLAELHSLCPSEIYEIRKGGVRQAERYKAEPESGKEVGDDGPSIDILGDLMAACAMCDHTQLGDSMPGHFSSVSNEVYRSRGGAVTDRRRFD